MLQEDLGLPTEKLICLYKECIEMAKHCNDMTIMISFVRFCIVSATMLQEDLGLSTEKLICLYKECIEMAKHCNDIDTMVDSCMQFVLHSNSIGRHADSLRSLKEILPSAVVIPELELLVHKYFSKTYEDLKEFDEVIFHAKRWIEIARRIEVKDSEMDGHTKMGKAFFSLTRYDDAIGCFERSFQNAQEIDSTEGEMLAYANIVLTYKRMQKYQDIILYASKFLDCAMRTNNQEAMLAAYLQLGSTHLYLNHYEDAIDCGKKCIDVAREIKERCGEVQAYLLMGRVHKALSDYDSAIIYCKKCIELSIIIGDKLAEAYAHSVLGAIYYSLGKYDDAISNCNKCLHIDKEDNEVKDADTLAYYTLGRVNQSLEKYDEAIQYFKQCIDIVNLDNSKTEMEVAACLCIGNIYETLKQYDNAIQYGKKCIHMAQETDDKETEMAGHFLLAQVHLASMQLNDVSLSIDAGLAIATELGDDIAEEKFKVIRSVLYGHVNVLDKAAKELLEVQTCSEGDLLEDLAQAMKTGDKIKRSRALRRLYEFYFSKKEHEKAINCLESLKEMNVNHTLNLFCFTEIGKSYQMMGENDMALRCFEEGLVTAESCTNKEQRSRFYYGIGKLLLLLNTELNLAERYLREATRCFEAIFTTLGSRDEFKISIFDKYVRSYKLLALLLIKGEQIKEALLVLDRCRARALKDLMISNYKMEREESNDAHLEYSDVLSLVSSNEFSISYYALSFNSVFLKFFLGAAGLHFLTHPHAFSGINDFLRICLYALFDEMGVFKEVNCEDRSLDKEKDTQKEQKTSDEEYEDLNQQTAYLLNLDSKSRESNEDRAETNGSTLEFLFAILECDRILSSKQNEVVIIPEGPLYQIPFAALRDPCTGKYISETKRIRLAPSLATLKHFEDFPTDQTSNAKPLIIGSPLVGEVMMDGEVTEIETLFGALDEAIDIAALLGVSPLVAANATKPAVLERLQEGVSVVHIAAHGILSKATIVLAPSDDIRATKIPDEEDYMLTMADVQQAKVRAQLVVLSCCHSGRGEIRAEGVVGMSRAFLASGCRAVVASLWAIDDDATFAFMKIFYGHLKNGKSTSTSLQLTISEMRNSADYKEPKYWAPFFLIGDDVTLKL